MKPLKFPVNFLSLAMLCFVNKDIASNKFLSSPNYQYEQSNIKTQYQNSSDAIDSIASKLKIETEFNSNFDHDKLRCFLCHVQKLIEQIEITWGIRPYQQASLITERLDYSTRSTLEPYLKYYSQKGDQVATLLLMTIEEKFHHIK